MIEEFWKWRNSMVLTDTKALSLERKWDSNFSSFWHATHITFLLRSYLPPLHSGHQFKITLKHWYFQSGFSKIVICVLFCYVFKMSWMSIVKNIIFLNPCFTPPADPSSQWMGQDSEVSETQAELCLLTLTPSKPMQSFQILHPEYLL